MCKDGLPRTATLELTEQELTELHAAFVNRPTGCYLSQAEVTISEKLAEAAEAFGQRTSF